MQYEGGVQYFASPNQPSLFAPRPTHLSLPAYYTPFGQIPLHPFDRVVTPGFDPRNYSPGSPPGRLDPPYSSQFDPPSSPRYNPHSYSHYDSHTLSASAPVTFIYPGAPQMGTSLPSSALLSLPAASPPHLGSPPSSVSPTGCSFSDSTSSEVPSGSSQLFAGPPLLSTLHPALNHNILPNTPSPVQTSTSS